MITGTGIDLCEIPRMAKAIEKAHFLERVFTPSEQARIRAASGPRRGEIAAGLFAAKEAVAKALGTGFDGFGPADIEILPDALGRPVCRLCRRAEALAAGGRIHVSITHEAGMAAAMAILESTTPDPDSGR